MPLNKITLKEYERRIKQRFPTESFTVLEYQSLGKPAVIRCNSCHNEIKIKVAGNFLAKNKAYGCVNCHGLWRQREVKWKEILKRYTVEEIGVVGTHKRYAFTCKKCGHVRKTNLKNLYEHLDCGCITGVLRRTEEEIKELFKDRYELVSSYKNITTKVKLKCNRCGFIWSVRPCDVMQGSSCPHCQELNKQSKGAIFIKEYLDKHNVLYKIEYPLKNSRQRFDFYILDKNIAIEYQGKQHYKYIKYFHKNNQGFKKYKERDERKRKYCTENNIVLLEIPYSWKNDTIVTFLNFSLGFNDYPAGE